MIGSWKGIYRYEDENIQKTLGFDETEFEIIIEQFDGKKFTGKVFDDENTGGMKGTGNIVGRVENNQIYFEKAMPLNCQLTSNGLKYSEKRHPIIYYYGKLSNNGEKFEGIWKFKNKLRFLFYFIPIIYCPCKGIWKMEQKNNI